jgi:alkyl sulfatase BDS1-like metallo-beta-lactamase superfamily hydrolase
MLAFHANQRIPRPTAWELRLADGVFKVQAEGASLTVAAGAPDDADLVITTDEDHLHSLLTRQLTPAEAVATSAVTLDGDALALPRLVELLPFPPSTRRPRLEVMACCRRRRGCRP